MPLKQAAVGDVSTHCPTRSTSRLPTPSRSIANSSALTPGRPSGVSSGASSRSMLASHLQPITDVAKPVIERPASSAHAGVAAVITTRAPHIGNASANVSTISAPCSFIAS